MKSKSQQKRSYNEVIPAADGRMPIKMWNEEIEVEERALEQLNNIAKLPFIDGPIAVMPDVHWGKGATIGSVIPTKGAVIPNAVGVDIGCGVLAEQLDINAHELGNLFGLRHKIGRIVPVGFSKARANIDHDHVGYYVDGLDMALALKLEKKDNRKFRELIRDQLGTLGGGNHFIELAKDENDRVWILVHSGSRRAGFVISQTFVNIARELMADFYVKLPHDDLAFLPTSTQEFRDYQVCHDWAVSYAKKNRIAIRDQVKAILQRHCDRNIESGLTINSPHNFFESLSPKEDTWLTRKGASPVSKFGFAVIPGTMGTNSFICTGTDDKDSYYSCSHGAGRAMGRREAKNKLDIFAVKEELSHVEAYVSPEMLDEAPAAYKDIHAVMHAQRDLVDIKHTLSGILCVKG